MLGGWMAFQPGGASKYLKKKLYLSVNFWVNVYKRTKGPC